MKCTDRQCHGRVASCLTWNCPETNDAAPLMQSKANSIHLSSVFGLFFCAGTQDLLSAAVSCCQVFHGNAKLLRGVSPLMSVLPTVTFSSSTVFFCCLTLKAGFKQQKLSCRLTVGAISIHWSQIWAFVAELWGSLLQFGPPKLFTRTGLKSAC